MTVIEFKDVNFGYSVDKLVLRDINMTISEPGLYCIIGPNGVGKSTIAKCISRIIEPISGNIMLDGKDLKEYSLKEVAKKVAFVPAHQNDVFSMSVVDTILVGRYNHNKWGSHKNDMKKVVEVMKLLHIEDLAYRKYNELSAGQHQKVTIARGLVQETPVVILDEPTANLDVQYQVYVTEMLRAIAESKGIIILMICHDLNIAAKYAHQVIMIARPGVVHAVGAPDEVITEENLERVYHIKNRIIEDDKCSAKPGKEVTVPHVILGEAIIEDNQ